MTSKQQALIDASLNPLKFFFFKISKLPTLAFWGVKLKELNEEKAVIRIKHGWRNQNPFGSMYFAALNGGGELSTGMLVLLHTADGNYSMLVTGAKANFTKKAKGVISFECLDGEMVKNKISVLKSSEFTSFDLSSIARDEEGSEVAHFTFTWSIKKK
jgi:acyl-coenzyme A thioesterase PaaI-like protein